MSDPCEQWRDVPGTNGHYQVSDFGQVKNVRLGRILKGHATARGHRAVRLSVSERKTVDFFVQRLVATVFLEPAPPGHHYATHKNGNTADNRADNLEWKTMPNIARRHALHGEENPRSKVCEADVREIRRRVAEGATRKEVAREFGIKSATVRQIVRRETWKHVE